MTNSRISHIKHAQRESMLLHSVARLFMHMVQDEPEFQELSITRVKLSPDKGHLTVYFHCVSGMEGFEKIRKKLVLYKPSLRKSLAQLIHGRYTPELRFMYDQQLDKQQHVENLIDKLKAEGKL